jgi:ABC-2 type transport system ATP-binding protein
MNGGSLAIDVRALRKTYKSGWLARERVEALRGVTLQIPRGEIFGLLGRNGAGKTTLIKVLLGIVRSSGGEALLLGQDAGHPDSRRKVGYLPEHPRIPEHHTGNSALEYYGGLSGLSPSAVRAKREALLATVGLHEWGRMSIRKYSKGMLQRLGIAQALLHDPELLILDEPTDGVDAVGRADIRRLLESLKSEGKTIFLNSHLLQEVELVCDRVGIMGHGLLARVGRVEELTSRPTNLIELQVVGSEEAIDAALAGHKVRRGPRAGQSRELSLELPDQRATDQVVDALRRAGVSVVELRRNRQTLEEAFLNIVAADHSEPALLVAEAVTE